MGLWQEIAHVITTQQGEANHDPTVRSVGGGCINQTYRLSLGNRHYFVKLNQASYGEMFTAEAAALQDLAQAQAVRVPQPLCWGQTGDRAYLVLEWLELGQGQSAAWEQLGRNLAALHRWQPPQGQARFGWHRSNTIGTTPQLNDWTEDWTTFWVDRRIGWQLQLARQRGGRFPQGDRLLAAIPQLLAGYTPQPALLHGDLWSGNAAVTIEGMPVIFDPATYWGDREADLAMTELFGRFPDQFYLGYRTAYPYEPGYEIRKSLYNLYHILNHFNLFGGGYASQANMMIDRLLRI
ncbi:MAG: fructosamine kinase family protein [Oscillatoriales cyanobacterium]|nr:MAG: fructosamine kinase family protein [Oscillatoriales cyanobacterium]